MTTKLSELLAELDSKREFIGLGVYLRAAEYDLLRAALREREGMVLVPRSELEHWREYWNGSYNERAMTDALDFLMARIDVVLAAAEGE